MVFSRFEPTSNLSLLNKNGVLRKPDRPFLDLLNEIQIAHRETEGAFDPTILPVLLHLERSRRPLYHAEMEAYLETTGFEKVAIYNDIVYLTDRRMMLTLDGIAKGSIVDMGVEFLRANGCTEALVNAGGDIYCGRKAGGWKVGIYDPLADGLSRTVTLQTMSICTSGSYVNYYTADKRLHHLIDPRTLTCPSDLVSATVTASTTARADMLSTALFIAGAKGKRFLRPGEKADLITRSGKKIVC